MADKRPVRVLSIDGGGIRGYLPAVFLKELERRASCPAADLFDLVVGTSTGAIIGIGLATGKSAEELADFYPKYGRRIFGGADDRSALRRRIFGAGNSFSESMDSAARALGAPFGGNPRMGGNARHVAAGLENVLEEVLGDQRLSDVDIPLAVTTFDRLTSLPVILSSREARADSALDLALRDAARATSAAPTFFPPFETTWAGQRREFVDGGVWANNPAAVAVVESLALTGQRRLTGASVLLVSLGTGASPAGSILDGSDTWLGPAMDLAGLATSVLAGEVMAERALGSTGYLRFQVIDARIAGAMNDPSIDRLDGLRTAAVDMIRTESRKIDDLLTRLAA